MQETNPKAAQGGFVRCKARSKRTGQPCQNAPVTGWKVCRMHGAHGGRPITNGNGRYSVLSGRIGEAYRASLSDPSLVDLRETLSVLDGVVKMQAARLADLDTPNFRRRAVELLDDFAAARAASDQPGMVVALNGLEAHLRRGDAESQAELELARRVQALSLRIEEERRLALQRQNAVNAKDLVELFVGHMADLRRILPEALAESAVEALHRRIDGPGYGGPLKIEEVAASRMAGPDPAMGRN